jgi:CheY-like chemotaxis protein
MRSSGRHPGFDWSRTDLGDRATWPHTLRLTVDILLHSPAPMLLVWGGERVLVFNDAYAALAGPHHPRAPGGKASLVWPEPLAAGREAFELAQRGEAAHQAGAALSYVHAHGREQPACDLYFTPIRDERDQVCGVLCSMALSEAPEAAAAAAGLRILVVEDNLDSQYLVCEMLKAFGHAADGVTHGEDALALLARARYDLLFSDVSLPGMSGVELARQALHAQPALKVIFASGYGEALLRHVEFPYMSLQKPYELEQLQAALAGVGQQLHGKP